MRRVARCPTCRALVEMPCLACRLRAGQVAEPKQYNRREDQDCYAPGRDQIEAAAQEVRQNGFIGSDGKLRSPWPLFVPSQEGGSAS